MKLAAAGAANVGEDAIKGHPAGLILIETLVEVVAQEAAALGDTGGVGAVHMGNSGGIKFEPGSEVAHGGKAESGNNGIFDDIDEFVDAAGLKTEAVVDGAVDRDCRGGCEAPVGTRDRLARAVGGVAHGEDVA